MRVWAVVLGLGVCLALAAEAQPLKWRSAQPLNTNAATDGNYGDYYPHLTHDGRGNWVCVWCAAIAADPDRDFEIYVARSSDNGLTWSAPELLDPFASDPSEEDDDFDPYVVTDGLGNWLTGWYTSDNHAGTVGDDTDLFGSRSTDLGATWTSSTPINSDAATDQDPNGAYLEGNPIIAVDPDGLWVAVWRRYWNPGDDFDIYTAYSSDQGATWSSPALLHIDMLNDIGDDSGVTVATDGEGHWIAGWITSGEIGDDGDLFYSTSTDGIIWTAPAPLHSDALTDGDLDHKWVEFAYANGRWLAVWSQGTYGVIDDDIGFVYSDDHGATWSDPNYLNTNATTDSARDWKPSIATDGHGRWVTVWYSENTLGLPIGTDDDIHYAVSEDNGLTWSDPNVVNDFAFELFDFQDDWNPKLAATPEGQWITVWHSRYDLGGIGTEWDIMFTTACAPTTLGDVYCDGAADLTDVMAMQINYAADASDPDYSSFDMDGDAALTIVDVSIQSLNLTGPAGQ